MLKSEVFFKYRNCWSEYTEQQYKHKCKTKQKLWQHDISQPEIRPDALGGLTTASH